MVVIIDGHRVSSVNRSLSVACNIYNCRDPFVACTHIVEHWTVHADGAWLNELTNDNMKSLPCCS